MVEEIIIPEGTTKAEKYIALIPQIEALVASETDITANIANTVAALKEVFGFFWIGFYVVKADQLVLAPFQGPIACTRINFGKGVCGTAWKEAQTIVVPDVDQFPGHIACSSFSKSEIVIPVIKNGEVVAVLDVDSDKYDNFDAVDEQFLSQIVKLLTF